MIFWFTAVEVAVCVVAGLLCLALGFMGRRPSDLSLGAVALVFVLLVANCIVSIIGPFAGNPCQGNVAEYLAYLISATLMPVLAVAWALVDRTRWVTLICGATVLAIAVMVYRMQVIWTTA